MRGRLSVMDGRGGLSMPMARMMARMAGSTTFRGDWAKLVKPATKFMLSVLCEADRMECHQGEVLRCFLVYSRVLRSPSMTSSADR